MRFCMLTTFFPPHHFGGDAIVVTKLANALTANGHQVEVVHCVDSFELLRGAVQPSPVPLDDRVRVHALRSPFGAISPLLTYNTGQPWLKSKELERILAQDFDVVHWHNLSLVGGPGALKLARGVRLFTLHEYWLICPTHILFKNNEEACVQRECLRCTLRHRRLPQLWRSGGFVPRALRHVDRFLTPSRFVQRRFEESPLQLKSTVLPHFIERQPLSPPNSDRAPYFLFVGRLEKAKGLQTVLPLFRKPGRRLLVVGAGGYESELRAQAADIPEVEFLGRLPHDKLRPLYAGAIATLVPSICFETFGLTVLESLEQATPVITSRFGALPEITADTGGGETYGDIEELGAILNRFEEAPEYGRSLGECGRAALERYSVNAHLDRYLAIIDEVRSGKPAPAFPGAV